MLLAGALFPAYQKMIRDGRIVGISDKCLSPELVNVLVMRRMHASLSRKAGIDPKLVADQFGHLLGVNLDVYTISDLGQRLESVNLLEQSLASPAAPSLITARGS